MLAIVLWGPRAVTDSMYLFRNDNPDPSELIREFGVTWRTPIPEGLDTDSLIAWKESVSAESYNYGQVVQPAEGKAVGIVQDPLDPHLRGEVGNLRQVLRS